MKKIAIDFHNVLGDLTAYWTVAALTRYGHFIQTKDVTDWSVWNVTPMTKEQFWDTIDWINDNGGNKYLEPLPGAVSSAFKLSCFYPCTVLTASRAKALPDIRYWLNKHGLKELPVLSTDGQGSAAETKFNQYDFDIYIDDNPRMIGTCPKDKYVILYDRPWNRSVTPNGVNEFRAKSWDEIITYCHGIQGVL